MSFFGDLVLVVEDQLLLGGVLFAIRVDRVKARPHTLRHNLTQRSGGVEFGSLMFVVHSCHDLLCSKELLLVPHAPSPKAIHSLFDAGVPQISQAQK